MQRVTGRRFVGDGWTGGWEAVRGGGTTPAFRRRRPGARVGAEGVVGVRTRPGRVA